ncbi:hypothetical protein [Spiroplasma tabanidicola]|uniref:Uncharacterized protein n=1 Tax=Spiroplasma tabanidicola TaxID=324079 RepID=A0A6I6C855_9MOLU|nr:hypothetical protein [Spiroplasma tabanidicola]QGS52410.1 hypothetical protein STABA_v1c10620 [Spiroplasma tabanidicola]
MTEKNSIIAKCEKNIKQLYTQSKKTYRNFLYNIILFIILFAVVIINEIVFKHNLKVKLKVNYVCIAFFIYLIFIFTIIGWFSTEYYYNNLKVFEYDINLKNSQTKIFRIVELNSVRYIFINIVSSFASTLIFSYLIYTTFEEYTSHKIYVEIGILSIHLLLIPAFVKMFETILEIINKYKKLLNHYLTAQFDSLKDLFEDAKFDSNYTHVNFEEYNLKSKHNIFLLCSKTFDEEDKKIIRETNEKILNRYKELWKEYTQLYTIFRQADHKKNKAIIKKLRNVLIIYINIWNDFFIF